MTPAARSAPLLVTERLELWLPTTADMHPMFEIVSHPATARHLGHQADVADQFQRFIRNAGSWFLYGYGAFQLREKQGDGSMIGTCGIFHSLRGLGEDFDDRPEAGWILRSDTTGKGYASEAMQAALDWFDAVHGPREVVCMIAPGNAPSIRVAEKFGFAALRDADLPDGDTVRLFRRAPPAGTG